MERIKTYFRRLGYRAKRWFSGDHTIFTVAIAACLLWTWGAISATNRNWQLEKRIESRRKELAILQIEISELELENQYYASLEYQELAAREKQNKILDGESLVYLPDNSDYARHKHDVSAAEVIEDEPSNYEQWLSFLFGT